MAKNPKVIEQTLTSMEVAEMVGKKHSELMKDVRRYEKYLDEGKIPSVDFWSESRYMDGKGEERPCYNITKKGCEFIAHKMTGYFPYHRRWGRIAVRLSVLWSFVVRSNTAYL